MNGVPNSQASNSQPQLITVSVNLSRLKKPLYYVFWIGLLIVVIIYVLFRDEVWNYARQGGTPPTSTVSQSPPFPGRKMYAGKGASGNSFTVSSSRKIRITVRDSTGSHIVINKVGSSNVVYTSKGRGSNFDDETYLEEGEYVVSVVAKRERSAKAFIEIQ